MRRLIIAALLSTTALVSAPDRAEAGPVFAFVGGFLNALGAGTWLASSALVGSWTAGFTAASWLAGGSLLARIVVSVGLSAIAAGLMPKPKMPEPQQIKLNYAQDVSFAEFVYGRVRKGGPLAFAAASSVPSAWDRRAKNHYGVIIAAHPTAGPVVHYLDDIEVTLDEDGFVTTHPIRWSENNADHCKLRTYTGAAGQAVDPIWRAVFPQVTDSDNFAGLSYAALYASHCAMELAATIYQTGREWVYAPVWDGENRILDPRTGLRGWTNNAALVIADIATRWYGKTVDWDEVAAEADICDQWVTNRDGGTQRLWTINTVIRGSMTWEETRAHLMMCCDAWFYERRDGKLGFKVGYYSAPTLTLTDADFSAVNLKHKSTGVDDVYSYAMRYVEPARDWAQEVTGAVVVGSNPATARDEQECYGIDSHNQAWRAVYRWAQSARPEWRISGTLKYIGREVMERRFVRVQLAELGVDAVFEVATLARNGGSHSWSLDAVSVEAADFAPDALTLEPARPVRTTVASDDTVGAPASLSGEVVEGTGGVAQIEWSWPVQPDSLMPRLRVRQDGGDWQEITLAHSTSSYLMTGLRDGSTYEAQIRNVTGAARVSAWAPEAPVSVEAIANTTPPGAMAYFSGMASGSSVALSWTAPNSVSYAAARIYRATGSTDIDDASLVGIEYGAPNATDEWLDAGPGAGAHSYWIEPVNGSGIGGPISGPQTVTIS